MTATPASHSHWLPSSKQNPCPLCGRTKDGDCRVSADGQQVICHHPKDFERGTVIDGWAFTRNTRDGRAGHFTIDKPKEGSRLARVLPFPPKPLYQATGPCPKPAPISGPIELGSCEPVEFDPSNRKWRYSPSQATKREDSANGKSFRPHHLVSEQQWESGAGPDPWPAYRQADAIKAAGAWVMEVEGEKCADIIRAGGRVAISQPGHAHKVEQITERYQCLVDAGVLGIVYLEDNDQEGGSARSRARPRPRPLGCRCLWCRLLRCGQGCQRRARLTMRLALQLKGSLPWRWRSLPYLNANANYKQSSQAKPNNSRPCLALSKMEG